MKMKDHAADHEFWAMDSKQLRKLLKKEELDLEENEIDILRDASTLTLAWSALDSPLIM